MQPSTKEHIKRLRKTGDRRCSAERPADDYLMTFDEDDLRTIYSTWRKDAGSYMKDATLAAHATMSNQAAQQLRKSVHGTHMFQVGGCKWLLHEFLRLRLAYSPTQTPRSSAARPAWHDLLTAFQSHRRSEEYRRAVANSQKKKKTM